MIRNITIPTLLLLLFSVSNAWGQIQFQLVPSTPFEPVFESAIGFSDVDGDQDQDLVITGRNSGSTGISRLYLNDGTGNFTWDSLAGLWGASNSSLDFADFDGDSDQDLIIAGQQSGSPLTIRTRLYENDGQGIFSEVTSAPFTNVQNCALGFEDVDGNNTPDLVLTGQGGGSTYIAELYSCDTSGTFSAASTPFGAGLRYSALAFADVDGDNDQDLLLTGMEFQSPSTVYKTKLFLNDGQGGFTEKPNTPFPDVAYGSVAFADVEGDLDMDLLICGGTAGSGKTSALFLNDGNGNFSLSTATFEGVDKASVAFADVDLDNDPDLLITGESGSQGRIAKLYENNGQGGFAEVTGLPFSGVGNGSVAFEDVNSDGLPDLVITGEDAGGSQVANLYMNDFILSRNAETLSASLKIFPNPALDKIAVTLTNGAKVGKGRVWLMNPAGQILLEESFVSGKEILISDLAPGIYFLRISSAEGFYSTRFLKL